MKNGYKIVSISANELIEWSKNKKGILGCELAEGFANRFIYSNPN